jgi:hypothetical protein
MTTVRRTLAVFLAVLLVAPMARAQNHVIGKATLDNAVQERVSREQADREAILSLLQRAEVRDIAARAGLSLDKAPAAVSTLHGTELAQAAAQARQVQNDLAGGASVIVISTTTIIILVLLIILIVLVTK